MNKSIARPLDIARRMCIGMTLLLTLARPVAAQGDPPLDGVAVVGSCQIGVGTGTIKGQVTASGGGPLAFADAVLYRPDGRRLIESYSDASGHYELSGLPAGDYLLQVMPPSLSSEQVEWYNDRSRATQATPIFVANGGTFVADVQLNAGSTISGHLSTADGQPVPNGWVTVYDSNGDPVASSFTNASGAYQTSPGLGTGTYRVGFAANNQPWLPEFYQDRPDLDAATAVAVTAPLPITNFDATLARAGQVVGRVTVGGIGVRANVQVSGTEIADYLTTDANGDYTTTEPLTSGVYTVQFLQYEPAQNLSPSTQTVVVTAGLTETVDGALTTGAQIIGHVREANGSPLQGVTVYAFKDDFTGFGSTLSDATGAYSVTGLTSGAYILSYNRADYITEFFDNQSDSTHAAHVAVSAPNITSGIDVTLDPGGIISGTVTAADTGLPLTEVDVTVVDEHGLYATSTSVDTQGRFQARDLRTGTYRVSFTPYRQGKACGYQDAWYSGKTTVESADPVAVTAPNTTANINIALSRGSSILGQVVSATTAEPIEGASALVIDANGDVVAEGSTNFLGYYVTTPPLPGGAYRVRFTDGTQGGIDEYFNNQLSLEAAAELTLTAPNDLSGISAALSDGGTLSGRVTAADTGAPLADISVTAYDTAGHLVSAAWTEADGRYTIQDGLATGSYRLAFEPLAFTELVASLADGSTRTPAHAESHFALSPTLDLTTLNQLTLDAAQVAASESYLPQFYSHKYTLSAADAVTVTAPNETGNVDVVLERGVFLPLIRR